MGRRSRKLLYDKDLMKAIKIDTNNRCIRCCKKHDPKKGYTLTVHHLDLNYKNNAFWNIAPLCQRCHLSLQRFQPFYNSLYGYWEYYLTHCEPWFKPYLELFIKMEVKKGG